MKAKLALLLIAAVVLSQNLFADSPLTSTPISEFVCGIILIMCVLYVLIGFWLLAVG